MFFFGAILVLLSYSRNFLAECLPHKLSGLPSVIQAPSEHDEHVLLKKCRCGHLWQAKVCLCACADCIEWNCNLQPTHFLGSVMCLICLVCTILEVLDLRFWDLYAWKHVYVRNNDIQLMIASIYGRHTGDMLVYAQYMQHLYNMRPMLSESEAFEQPYWDYLQVWIAIFFLMCIWASLLGDI